MEEKPVIKIAPELTLAEAQDVVTAMDVAVRQGGLNVAQALLPIAHRIQLMMQNAATKGAK